MAELGPVSPDLVEKVAEEFSRALKRRKTAGRAAAQLPDAEKEKRDEKVKEKPPGNLNSLLSLDPDHLASLSVTSIPRPSP